MREVFWAFLKLGLSSFGGPIAHIGYFHREFVVKRAWLDEERYAQLLAISQFLPGPASSQVGFSVGLLRAGWLGGLAAWAGFTLPSASLLFAFAHLAPRLDTRLGAALLHAFKLVAVVVVASGLATMAQRLAPDVVRRAIAVGSALIVLLFGATSLQLIVIAAGALCGLAFCREHTAATAAGFALRYGARTSAVLACVFVLLLVLALLPASESWLAAAAQGFYRAGALVFGGAHVVLPLLEEAVVDPGWISEAEFLVGYGAAQVVPGPMFSIAAFLGAQVHPERLSALGAAVSLAAIFLPGLLLMAAVLPVWSEVARRPRAQRAIAGINATVVGLLAAALYDPVLTSAIASLADIVIAAGGFVLLWGARRSVLAVLGWTIVATGVATTLGMQPLL
jgi:chromate transporter